MRCPLRAALALVAGVFGFAADGSVSAQQAWPQRPIKIVVPYSAGGSGDIVAREIAQRLSGPLGVSVFVENKPGANGNIGADSVAKSAPDGYTLLLGSDIQFAISPNFSKNMPFKVSDFEPISLVATVELVLAAHPKLGVKSVPELAKLAKAEPGKINFASTGPGSTHQLAMEYLQQLGGFKLTHVPYKGSAQALPDLISGQVELMLLGIPQTLPYLRQNSLVALAVGAKKRVAGLPEIATVAESAFPEFEANNLWCLYAPAGTPKEVVARLHGEVVKVISAPDLRQRFISTGLEPHGSTPAELASRIDADSRKWAKVIKDLGLQAQ